LPDEGALRRVGEGVDIFLPTPDDKYQMTSGTSFSAAYISGLATPVLERNPALKPEEVRAILTKTTHDLGASGCHDLFGAGEADAYAAFTAVNVPAPPAAAVSGQAAAGKAAIAKPPTEKVFNEKVFTEKALEPQDVAATRALKQPAKVSDKSRPGGPDCPAAQ
jgi:subtilisin family serine protease